MTQLTWTYNTLTTALQNWLDDADSDWNNATTLAQLVYLGEMRLVQDLDLTIFDVAATVSLPAGTGSNNVVSRPANILFTDEMFYQIPTGPSAGKNLPIERRDYGWVMDYLDPAVTGPPVYYAEQDATNYVFAPYADQTYAVNTFGPYAHQSLNDVAPTATTWISTNLGDLLLGSCMIEAARFLKNQGKKSVETELYTGRVTAMKVRLRSLRRSTTEQPRTTGATAPEGALPAAQPTTVQS